MEHLQQEKSVMNILLPPQLPFPPKTIFWNFSILKMIEMARRRKLNNWQPNPKVNWFNEFNLFIYKIFFRRFWFHDFFFFYKVPILSKSPAKRAILFQEESEEIEDSTKPQHQPSNLAVKNLQKKKNDFVLLNTPFSLASNPEYRGIVLWSFE